jgi:hypothetical protein
MAKGYWPKSAANRPDCDFLVTFVARSPQFAIGGAAVCDADYSVGPGLQLNGFRQMAGAEFSEPCPSGVI